MPDPEALFRSLALALPAAVESSHMGAPDFRLGNRIFATLAFRARGLGTLKLTPGQQASFLAELPAYTEPAPGGWGRRGMTLIRLDAPAEILGGALLAAYNNVKAAHTSTVNVRRSTLDQPVRPERTGRTPREKRPLE